MSIRVGGTHKENEYIYIKEIEVLPRIGETIEYCQGRFESDPLVGVVENVTHEFTSEYKVIIDIKEFDDA